MAVLFLHVDFESGESERIRLTPQEPISIGKNLSNHVVIEQGDVAPMHCRICWSKEEKGYEAVAASQQPLNIDGTEMSRVILTPGMVLRVSHVDILVVDETEAYELDQENPNQENNSEEQEDNFDAGGLKPITEDQIPNETLKKMTPSSKANLPKKKPSQKSSRQTKHKKGESEVEDFDDLDDLEEITDFEEDSSESLSENLPKKSSPKKSSPKKSSPKKSSPKKSSKLDKSDPLDTLLEDYNESGGSVEQEQKLEKLGSSSTEDDAEEEADEKKKSPFKSRLPKRRPKRPGEQEVFKSPLIFGLISVSLILLLVSVTYIFLNARSAAERQYNAAVAMRDEGSHGQAIQLFSKFIADRPGHPLAKKAIVERSQITIEMNSTGANPRWEKGLAALKGYIEEQRDSEEFTSHHADFVKYGMRIAEGSARDAGKFLKKDLLIVSTDAEAIGTRYQPKDQPLTDTIRQIATLYQASEKTILANDVYLAMLKNLDAAIKNEDSIGGLKLRRNFLIRYPNKTSDKKIRKRLEKLLAIEKKATQTVAVNLKAELSDANSEVGFQTFTLTPRSRSRSGRKSNGKRITISVANGSCFGIDTITGGTAWKRVLGTGQPFFPEEVEAAVPSLLAFNTNTMELQLFELATGKLTWRQKLTGIPVGKPAVHESNVYILTEGKQLWRLSLDSGEVTSQVTFPQELVGTPVVARDDNHLIIAGSQAILYTLGLRPLECQQVTFLAHPPGSVVANMIAMGESILVCQNKGLTKCRLIVLGTADLKEPLEITGEMTIEGPVIDAPMKPGLRGKQLFIPSRPERITAFSVSDKPGDPPLTLLTSYQVEGASERATNKTMTGNEGRMSLKVGPNKELWMGSTAVRKFKLISNALVPGKEVVAVGVNAHPLKSLGEDLFMARKVPYANAVFFSQANRSTLKESQWQIILGTKIIGFIGKGNSQSPQTPGDKIIAVNGTGGIFQVLPSEKPQEFLMRAADKIGIPKSLVKPLGASQLEDGRVVVWTRSDQSRVVLVNASGQKEKTLTFSMAVQAAPVIFQKRLVIPLTGRLRLKSIRSGSKVDDYLQPFGDAPSPVWQSIHVIDETNLLTVDNQGNVARLQYRTSPKRHLNQVSSVNLKPGLRTAWSSSLKSLIVLTSDQSLQLLDGSALEVKWKFQMKDPISQGPWFVGKQILYQTAAGKLVAREPSGKGNVLWSVDLPSEIHHSPSLLKNQIIFVTDAGSLKVLSPSDGAVNAEVEGVPALSLSPQQHLDNLVLCTQDGSLQIVSFKKLLSAKPKTNSAKANSGEGK